MGYRGKVQEQEEARRLRALNWTIPRIAKELHVSKSSVSLWVRDVPFTPSKRRYGPQARYHPWQTRKLQEIADMNAWGIHQLGRLGEDSFLAAGTALYAGEGSKSDGKVNFREQRSRDDEALLRVAAAVLRYR